VIDVWVFNGATNQFPSAVFENRESAEEWIRANALTGTLTRYPGRPIGVRLGGGKRLIHSEI
jgi:hypothetical protein